MSYVVTSAELPEYERFLQSHEKGHFCQSPLWAALKSEWRFAALASRGKDGQIKGGLSFLVRKLPVLPNTMMYGCRGPVCDPSDKETIKDLLEGAKELAKTYRAYCVKLDPDIPASNESFRAVLEEAGFKHVKTGKNFEGVQPRFVFRNQIGGMDEDSLLQSFSSKTRYNIRLAERKGVSVILANEAGLDDFSRLMIETGVRDGFVTRSKGYFRELLKCMGPHARLYMAYFGETAVAGTLAVHYGDKVWYLYGASGDKYRNLMPNYLLQWEMMKWALEKKCRLYDFRGVSGDLDENNPLYGLYRFKRGFNGDFTEFLGEFDYIPNRLINFAAKKGQRALTKAAVWKYMKKNRQPGSLEKNHEETVD